MGLGITFMIAVAVYIRLSIYKDEEEMTHNEHPEIASPASPNEEIELVSPYMNDKVLLT